MHKLNSSTQHKGQNPKTILLHVLKSPEFNLYTCSLKFNISFPYCCHKLGLFYNTRTECGDMYM